MIHLIQSYQWPTEVPIDKFWPLPDVPLGYIATNDHGGPRVVPSGRMEYAVLVPIYGLTVSYHCFSAS